MFEPSIWSKLHGASTHFPIALMLVAAFCDTAGLVWCAGEARRRFHFSGSVTLVLGTLGSYLAVVTGLITTKGEVWGHGTLLKHHQWVWPAFAMMTALAGWRVATRREPSKRAAWIQLAFMWITAAAMGAAGYWGGELFSEG